MLILEYHLQEILQGTKSMRYAWIIDQACNPDCCLLAKFFFFLRVWGTKTESRSIDTQRKEQSQYQAWSIKDILWVKRTPFLSRDTVDRTAPSCPLR